MANFNIDYLVVAGGGGAGAAGVGGSGSGGGGAGGLLTSIGSTALVLTPSVSYTIKVGQGGSGAVSVVNPRYTGGNNGSDSEFSGTGITTITAIGGGGGGSGNGSGSNCNSCLPNTGGSGGGTGYGGPGAQGTTGQGNNGGISASGNPYAASGGGGAGGAGSGAPNNSTGGSGGLGLTNSITVASGTGPFYAGGGGGSPSYNGSGTPGTGGSGIGGYGTSGLIGGNGIANTGSGGGAGSSSSSSNSTGGTGGSGIVIFRYATADIAGYTATGLTPTEDTTTISGQTILSFTTVGTGTIIFTAPVIPTFSGTRVTNPVTGFESPVDIGLKLPSGTNDNLPTAVQGMIRNDTSETTGGSASAIIHYNGADWKYFAATESVDNPLFASQNFNTVLYDGNSGVKTINTVGFQPDLVWTKATDYTGLNGLTNSINGDKTFNVANTTATIDSNDSAPKLFNSLGFTLGSGNANWNSSSYDYVSWNWKAGGLINKSADFNGSSSYITPSSSSTLTGLTKAVSIWIKSDNFTSLGTWPFQQGNGQGAENYIRFYNGSDIQIRWGNQDLTSSGYSTGVWYHIVAQEDANGFANFWIDGVEIATSTSSLLSVTGDTNIGRRFNSPSYQHYFNGQMAQLRLFSSSLDSTQIAQLYNETKADNSVLNYPSGAGCIAAYPLGENANGLDGLYNGTASNVTFGKPGYLTRNTEGTIESTVSANVAAGFSIVGYTGNGTAGSTVGHGLASTPEMVIVKSLTSTANQSWSVYHVETGPTKSITLELTNTPYTNIGYWNNTSPTSIDFTLGNYAVSNQNNANYIAYCWHSVAGYSKISSYVGNGNTTGVLQELGFEPAFLMFKCVTQSGNWIMIDNKRATSNPRTPHLRANTSGQDDPGANEYVDFISTGFQPKGVSNYNNNSDGQTYIYMAFATS